MAMMLVTDSVLNCKFNHKSEREHGFFNRILPTFSLAEQVFLECELPQGEGIALIELLLGAALAQVIAQNILHCVVFTTQ